MFVTMAPGYLDASERSSKLKDLDKPAAVLRPHSVRRPITVADTIEMTDLSGWDGVPAERAVAFSPDGSRFIVVITRGDLEKNERIFSLLLYQSDELFNHTKPQTLAVMRTGSNRPGIDDVRWSGNELITFLGAAGKDITQVYALDTTTRELRCLTSGPTNVTAYALAPDHERLLYSAEFDTSTEIRRAKDRGFTVLNQSLTDIISGHLERDGTGVDEAGLGALPETFIIDKPGQVPKAVSFEGVGRVHLPAGWLQFSRNPISPNGRYAVAQGLKPVPREWLKYSTPFPREHPPLYAPFFAVIDLDTGIASELVDAPTLIALGSAIWSPDSRSLVLTNTYLPSHYSEDGYDSPLRSSRTSIVEINLETRTVRPIDGPAIRSATTDGAICARPLEWTASPQQLVFGIRRGNDNRGGECTPELLAAYHKRGGRWIEIKVQKDPAISAIASNGRVQIEIAQDLNTPRDLRVRDLQKRRNTLITDLNPQLREVQLAAVTLIKWTAVDGFEWSGTLYTPPDASGERTPLVIQTHGCYANEFMVNGMDSSTGFAAQVLASKGITVLQMGKCGNPNERWRYLSENGAYSADSGEFQSRGYEAAVDFLDRKGLIDRERVGLQGHSVTGWGVVYPLAHPKPGYHYAAVLASSWGDAGYFNYIAASEWRTIIEVGNGAAPIGSSFDVFHQNALTTLLGNVTTPLMIQEADGTRYLPYVWETYTLLKLMGKPVELIVFPEGIHNLVRPWEKLTSQQAAVDWFCFWLKSEERADAVDHEQFARWRKLKAASESVENSSMESRRSRNSRVVRGTRP